MLVRVICNRSLYTKVIGLRLDVLSSSAWRLFMQMSKALQMGLELGWRLRYR